MAGRESLALRVVTGVVSAVNSDVGTVIGLAVAVTLLGLLVVRELATNAESPRARTLSYHLDVPVVILLCAFIFIIGFKLLPLIR
jgi:hypothetical protein